MSSPPPLRADGSAARDQAKGKTMKIFNAISSLISKVKQVGRLVLPLLNIFRDSSPEIDRALDKVEDVIESGEEAADDFFDRNAETVDAMHEFFGDLQALGAKGQEMTGAIITATRVETPDRFTPAEAEWVGGLILEVKDLIRALGKREQLIAAIEKME